MVFIEQPDDSMFIVQNGLNKEQIVHHSKPVDQRFAPVHGGFSVHDCHPTGGIFLSSMANYTEVMSQPNTSRWLVKEEDKFYQLLACFRFTPNPNASNPLAVHWDDTPLL